eukprot:9036040-Pyramimonas_sp.AAC.1
MGRPAIRISRDFGKRQLGNPGRGGGGQESARETALLGRHPAGEGGGVAGSMIIDRGREDLGAGSLFASEERKN